MPPQVLAAAVVLQSLHGLSDFETVLELRRDLRGKAACGLGLLDTAFDVAALQRACLLRAGRGPVHRRRPDPRIRRGQPRGHCCPGVARRRGNRADRAG
ncbi:transposase [Streptomyces lydicus]|uniref:transposase n=1 Tax=Streptomyces lydicus TaxID=47763 RepID=UPI0037A941E5